MTAQSRAIIREVAQRRHLDPVMIVSKRKHLKLMWARIEITKRLNACRYSTNQIGRILNRHHTAISYYLGHLKGKTPTHESKQRWRKPQIVEFDSIKPKVRRYLIPYAGADMREYHWQERPHA